MTLGRAFTAAAGVALIALPASGQVVTGWGHERSAGVDFAFFTGAQQELTVRCKGKDVEVVYYIDPMALDPSLRSLSNVELAVRIDDADDFEWIDSHLVVENDVVFVGVGGQVAKDIVHDIAAAKRSVVVGVLTGPPQVASLQYNQYQFPIFGAVEAIKAAYAGCGIPF